MTIVPYGNNIYVGLDSDTKPTTNIPNPSFFISETQLSRWNGSTWSAIGGSITASSTTTFTNKTIDSLTNTVKNIGSITYVVWIESGPTYKARRTSTGVITSDTNAQTFFETIINAMATGSGNVGGKIYVHEGVYPVTTRIKIGSGTYPNSQVEIEGAGKDVTIFRYTGAQTGDGDEAIFQPFCHTDLRNLTVDGNGLSTHNITCIQPIRIGIYNCHSMKHIGIGIYISSTVKGFDIRSCQIDDASGAQDQIAINCVDYGFFIGNFVDRRTGAVLTASSVTAASLNNAVIADNVILREPGSDELAGASLALENWDKNYKNVTIENNTFYKGYVRIGSGHDVIGGATYRNIVFNNNVLDKAQLWIDGPSATSAASTLKDIHVTDNIISDSWDVGMRVVKAAGPVIISNNTIKESNRSAASNGSNNRGLIFINDSDFVTIENNKLYMTNSGTNLSPYGIRTQNTSDRTLVRYNYYYITNSNPALQDDGTVTNYEKYGNHGLSSGNANTIIETLSNKTISGSNNTISNVPDSALSSNVALENIANVFTAGQTVSVDQDDLIDLYRPTNIVGTRSGLYVDLQNASNTRVTYGRIVGEITNNTAGAENGQLRFQTRTAGAVTTKMLIGSAGDFTFGSNLRLNLNDTGLTAQRDFTFPDIAGKVAVIGGPDIAQNPLNKRWGMVQPGYGTAVGTVGVMDGFCQSFTPTGAGSNTTSYDTTEGKVINYQTSSASGVIAGLASPVAGGIGRRLFGGRMICRFKLDSTTSARFYFGLTSATALPISDTPLATSDSGIIVGFTSADTNYQIRTNDGATSVTTTAMTGTIAKTGATNFHTIEISWTASGNYIVSYDGTAQTISSDLPATTTDLFANLMVQTSAVVQRTLTLKALYMEADK